MPRLLLIGAPNTGKSLLFNRLTGLRQKVANFPGITVDTCRGPLAEAPDTELVDYPGTYSLRGTSGEEGIANAHFARALSEDDVVGALCLVDSTRLGKSLVLAQEVVAECALQKKPVLVVANMGDVLSKYGAELDREMLSRKLGAEVLVISAKTGAGTEGLVDKLRSASPPREGQGSKVSDEDLARNATAWARQAAPDLGRLLGSKLDWTSSFWEA